MMNRRRFLSTMIGTAVLAACGKRPQPRIGLALGGGGARGLAHIPLLETLDALGIRPHRIAGTSIGAIIGSLYCAGHSGAQIRATLDGLTVSKDEHWLTSLFTEDIHRWLEFIEVKLGSGGLLNADAFLHFLQELLGVSRFRDLAIPLQVVATDLWNRQQVVFEHGELIPALKASMAVPGLFSPVEYRGRFLVDGGLVNPVPYDLLFDDCDYVIAIDVLGRRSPQDNNSPSLLETSFHSLQIMQAALMREKLQRRAPDLYLRPDLENIRLLDFNKIDLIFQQAAAAQEQLQAALHPLLRRST